MQSCCKSLEKLSGVCNTVASLTKNFLAFATLLQVSRKTFWRLQHCCKSLEKLSGVCNTVASPTKNFLAFATLLQVSRRTFRRLQHCCKSHEKLFGVCRNAAKAAKNYLEFAGTLQVLRKTIWSLQECCKGLEKLSGVCNIVASISKSTLAATTLYRKHPIGIRNPIPASNIRSGGVWRAKPSVYLRPTAIFDAVTLLLPSLPCIGVHRQEKRARLE